MAESEYSDIRMNKTARVTTVNPLPPDANTVVPAITMPETVNRTMTSDGRQIGSAKG